MYGADRRPIKAVMPEFVAGPFVARLLIWKHPDSRLAATCKQYLPDTERLRTLVLLRNARCAPDPQAMDWLCRLIRTAGIRLQAFDFLEHWALALDLMETLPQGMPVSDYLKKCRADWLAALKAAQTATARQQEGPMEVLIMARRTAPYVDVRLTRKKITMIDTLCAFTR
jgi:hypothetical protein